MAIIAKIHITACLALDAVHNVFALNGNKMAMVLSNVIEARKSPDVVLHVADPYHVALKTYFEFIKCLMD
jgi:hypothetical protein